MFPVLYSDGAFRILSPALWQYVPGSTHQEAYPILPSYRSQGTDKLAQTMLDKIKSPNGQDGQPPVVDGEDAERLRAEIRGDFALLSSAFGGQVERIRFRPACTRDILIRRMGMSVPAWGGKAGDQHPHSAFPTEGAWIIAEAVLVADGVECPIAQWNVVEADDGICRLASSAYSSSPAPPQEEADALRAAGEAFLRRIRSSQTVCELATLARTLPPGPGGPPLLALPVLPVSSAIPVP